MPRLPGPYLGVKTSASSDSHHATPRSLCLAMLNHVPACHSMAWHCMGMQCKRDTAVFSTAPTDPTRQTQRDRLTQAKTTNYYSTHYIVYQHATQHDVTACYRD